MITKLDPLHEWLDKEITPEELCEYLDALYYECSMMAMKSGEETSKEIIDGLYYVHALKEVLEHCTS
jgi:hypothetical protein